MKPIIIRFGLLAVALLALIQLNKYAFYAESLVQDLLIGASTLMLIVFGFLLYPLLIKRKKSRAKIQSMADAFNLTKREVDVLAEMMSGKSNKEIGEQLFISESTVKTHASNILLKLNVKRRAEAITLVNQRLMEAKDNGTKVAN